MGKGQITKEHIIRQSAGLFNTKGYMGASLSDIIKCCNVGKGGIYNHFQNKEDIALAAFDYSFSKIKSMISIRLENTTNSEEKLLVICEVYVDLIENDLLEGGCPILNTAIENDDGHPLLKERAQNAMRLIMDSLSNIIKEGIEKKQFRSDINLEELCSYIVAVIEGGVMLSKLFNDSKYIRHCTSNVTKYIKEQILTPI
jgi:TetR/AcrR family transcriptional repressor of nem operon